MTDDPEPGLMHAQGMTIQEQRSDSADDADMRELAAALDTGYLRTGDVLGVGNFWDADSRAGCQQFITELGLNFHAVYHRAGTRAHRP